MLKTDLNSIIVEHVEEMRKAGGYPSEEALNRLAAQIALAFDAKKDEVALLRLTADGRVLRFIYPIRLSKIGVIPTSIANSLAAKTARDGKGEIVNNFPHYKHPTVFESINLSEFEEASPIHKIMSVPMMTGAKVVGVIQISRKERMAEPLGADFTPRDLFNLNAAGKILGEFFATLPSDPPKPTPGAAR